MIPAIKDVTVLSNVSGDTIDMDIDPTQYMHLMSLMTNIYEDVTAAVIREYITNALDSHKAAGQTRPIEVSGPGRLSPSFVVEDFGVGMSAEDIRNTYARYGASTKRESNTEAGSYGIGSKSGLAFGAGQFHVTARKDGIQTVVLVGMRENGTGGMDIISSAPTTQPNGVKVTIPVNTNQDLFMEKLRKFHKFVTPGKMLLNGEESERLGFDQINEKLAIHESSGWQDRQSYVVMGDVYYPIDNNVYGRISNNFNVIFYVDIGDVHITPSREGLNYTAHTRKTLDAYSEMFNDSLIGHLQTIIDLQPNIADAFNKQSELRNKLDYGQRDHVFQYNGADLPQPSELVVNRVGWNYSENRYCRNYDSDFIRNIDDHLFISNWTNLRFTRPHADKIDAYIEANGLKKRTTAYFLSSDIDTSSGLFDNVTLVDWEDIKKMKIARRASAPATARSYLGSGGGVAYGNHIPDNTKNIWYGSKSELGSNYWTPDYRDIARAFTSDNDQFFYVTTTEEKKFLRTYPKARKYTEFYTSKLDTFIASLDDYKLKIISLRDGISNSHLVRSDKVDDPELVEVLTFASKMSTTDRDVVRAYKSALEWTNKLSYEKRQRYLELLPDSQTAPIVEKLEKKYPLLVKANPGYSEITDEFKDHMAWYVNSVYTSVNKKEN